MNTNTILSCITVFTILCLLGVNLNMHTYDEDLCNISYVNTTRDGKDIVKVTSSKCGNHQYERVEHDTFHGIELAACYDINVCVYHTNQYLHKYELSFILLLLILILIALR